MLGRDQEQAILTDLLSSNRAEFIAIYGRRRVGKTFLVDTFFSKKDVLYFRTTGEKDGAIVDQIQHFTRAIGDAFYHGAELQAKTNWDDTFYQLTQAIKNAPLDKKIVLFMDEFPWMASAKSKLLGCLDYYWNHHWSKDKRIKLVICGSSASWIINKIIKDTGGLHNRITRELLIEPFNLKETKAFLNHQGIRLKERQITDVYMLTGGIPYYLSHAKKGLSATEIIEQLAFRKTSPLLREFDILFASLFSDFENNLTLIRAIAKKRYGIEQQELLEQMDKNLRGETGLKHLQELQDAGFITRFTPYGYKQRGSYYRITDEYTLFYLKWIEPILQTLLLKGAPKGYWQQQQNTPTWRAWSGLAFEAICYKHVHQIANALELSPASLPYTWRYAPTKGSDEKGAQIDLLFDRDDDAITICEIKYTTAKLVVDKKMVDNINNKQTVFREKSRSKKQLFIALITTHGLQNCAYSDTYIDKIVTLDALFKD